MPLGALSTFRPHVPPPIEWEPLEVTTSIESVVEGLEEPSMRPRSMMPKAEMMTRLIP